MPKGRNRKLPPPFDMNRAALWQWFELQDEFGGTFRGQGFSVAEIWKLGVIAEHQADYRRRHLEDKYFRTMQEYRLQFGLPALPPIQTKAA